ncbi:TIGR04282 family arsenosugar biosynthesis glycosyltransferase [Crocinitomix algicola]|uniref:TIGR04282 family arsenosugar biosynthesis glycosyltransferase n=1 Tax=Crocinitomix algicola TaxID=1740263 RepID=UPI0008323518|nr:TIGR04282 family arsenosugar biosynthesis glycosyltransferase [Crocinitomix algicola]
MKENLLIVFAKNKIKGKAKTRLAKSIGQDGADEVYTYLYHLTERESEGVSNADVQVHFSNFDDLDAWGNSEHFLQAGETLGDRMKGAFLEGFERGYKRIIGIGADLPDINSELLSKAFEILKNNDFIFGPAADGGYYLIGLQSKENLFVFDNKPWSTDALLKVTVEEVRSKNKSLSKLPEKNDIDTLEDLRGSNIADLFSHLYS